MAFRPANLIPVIAYFIVSIPVFNKVYETTQSVIDEEFHLRQGLHYCNKRFSEWDKKITTFPGLYMASIIVIPFDMCNVYGLRLVSLLASVFNVYIIFKIRERMAPQQSYFNLMLESLSISLLPPLYFFSNLYYTDVLSMTFVLAMFNFWCIGAHSIAAIFGALSVLVRQTNVVWVVLLLGTCFFNEFIDVYADRQGIRKKSTISLFSLKTVWHVVISWRTMLQIIVNTFKLCIGYIAIIVVFIAFMVWNGSIVVGDKSAHEATLHIPQVFYFAIFTLFFGAPVMIEKLKESFRAIARSKNFFAGAIMLFSVIVRCNTMAHPYLLADNRHYTFYIWNRFYGKYEWFKYSIIPFYVFAFKVIQLSTENLSSGFRLMFWISSLTALCGQKLLELRYFLIPFVILRLNIKVRRRRYIILELLWNVCINFLMLMTFFKKEIYWSNYVEPQRIIW